ncbi:MAG: hybrid sensor histidine kinase/response regulator, partial [Campylobacterota bacterium]|nr:hybrid sensor histidine kinase/response regulator [Campylobacterota bacterium]
MHFSVKNKLFFIFISVIVLSVSIIGWLGFSSAKEAYIESALTINKGETKALSNEIKGVLGTIPDDVLYNSDFYALEKLIVWEELKDRQKVKHWRNVYVSALKGYLYNKKLYYQLRILDIKGNEKILLKYNESINKIVETPLQNLKNKSHQNYFKKAINLKKGEFYISIMDLNVEDGHIEKPYIPVVRYSTPIVDENGVTQGVIVLNFNANNILKLISNTKSINETRDVQKYYLLNEDSYYLFIEDKSKRWGFQLENDHSFNKDYPNIMKKFKSKDEITFIDGSRIFSMHKIYPNKIANPYRYWYLVTVIDKNVSLQSLNSFIIQFFTILIVILVIGLLLINSFITRLISPLERVKLQLQALANGEIKKESIKYSANDEIFEIINSTSILVNAIETIINQANLVADGNFTKEIELLSKNDKLGLALQNMMTRLQEITALSQKLSVGDYNVEIVAKSSSDELGLALINMVKYLEKITKVAESISVGDIDVKHSVKGEDDRLGIAIEKMVEYLKTILHQANSITNEEFTQSIEPKSKRDELAIAIVTMTDMLRHNHLKNKNEVWFSEGINQFSDIVAESSDIVTLAKNSITKICRYIEASSGVFYTFNKEDETLGLVASYAYTSRDALSNSY